MSYPDITFRPVETADLALLADWIARPHWQDWWGDPDEELAMIGDMVEGRDPAEPFLILLGGQPVGYIQSWRVADMLRAGFGDHHPWLAALPEEAVGVDLSLASDQMLGKGIGSVALKAFVERLRRDGHCLVIIDPAADNHRAIGAYRKAGFVSVPNVKDCPDDIHIMVCGPYHHQIIQTNSKTVSI